MWWQLLVVGAVLAAPTLTAWHLMRCWVNQQVSSGDQPQQRPHQVDNPGDKGCEDGLVTHDQVLPWLPSSVRADFPAARTDEQPTSPAVCRVDHRDGVTRPRAHVHPPVMPNVPPAPPVRRPARRCRGDHDWIDIRSMNGSQLRVCSRCDADDADLWAGLPLAREWW